MTDVTRFVDQHLADEPKLLRGDIPEEMIDASAEAVDHWQPWRTIPANVSADDLDGLESELGVRLLRPFREFHSYLHFLELNTRSIRFCEHPPSWREAKVLQQDVDLFSEDGRSLVPV